MSDRLDPMSISHQAMNRVYARLTESWPQRKDSLGDSPAVPLTDDPDKVVAEKPRSKVQRRFEYLKIRNDEALLTSLIDERIARHKLPSGMLPRDLVMDLVEAEREFQESRGVGDA